MTNAAGIPQPSAAQGRRHPPRRLPGRSIIKSPSFPLTKGLHPQFSSREGERKIKVTVIRMGCEGGMFTGPCASRPRGRSARPAGPRCPRGRNLSLPMPSGVPKLDRPALFGHIGAPAAGGMHFLPVPDRQGPPPPASAPLGARFFRRLSSCRPPWPRFRSRRLFRRTIPSGPTARGAR